MLPSVAARGVGMENEDLLREVKQLRENQEKQNKEKKRGQWVLAIGVIIVLLVTSVQQCVNAHVKSLDRSSIIEKLGGR
jgi:hypothetical protein